MTNPDLSAAEGRRLLAQEVAKHFNDNPSFAGWTAEQEEWLYDELYRAHWAREPSKALAAAPRLLAALPALLEAQERYESALKKIQVLHYNRLDDDSEHVEIATEALTGGRA